jgi:catechol 2,3-dioxygenase-like lactoylglutathione lyase family enzyme
MPLVDHVDLVVSSIDRSLPFYRALLAPLGWIGTVEQRGERGETIHLATLDEDPRAELGILPWSEWTRKR